MPSGDLHIHGRIDRQVKIRGHRIELGEIEAALNELQGVKQTVVIDMELGKRRFLAAYIVGSLTVDDARVQLSA
jgi:iturin family lipopeptide synthetase C